MTVIVGISGSLRRNSFNSGLLRAARDCTPQPVRFEIASIAGIPLYDADIETAQGIPDSVSALK